MKRRARRSFDKRDPISRHEARPTADNLKAVSAGIGAAVQVLYSGVLREEVPDKIAELLRKLDQQEDASAL